MSDVNRIELGMLTVYYEDPLATDESRWLEMPITVDSAKVIYKASELAEYREECVYDHVKRCLTDGLSIAKDENVWIIPARRIRGFHVRLREPLSEILKQAIEIEHARAPYPSWDQRTIDFHRKAIQEAREVLASLGNEIAPVI